MPLHCVRLYFGRLVKLFYDKPCPRRLPSVDFAAKLHKKLYLYNQLHKNRGFFKKITVQSLLYDGGTSFFCGLAASFD